MRKPIFLALLVLLYGFSSAGAAPQRIGPAQAALLAQERFIGEVVDVSLDDAEEGEPGEQVYEVKLLTPGGDVLSVRIAALDGQYLGVEGPDLARALRPAPARRPSP